MILQQMKLMMARCSTMKHQPVFPSLLIGYTYDELETSNSFQIRSLLQQIFKNNVDEAFHMATRNLFEAIHSKDFRFISQIAHSKLCRTLQLQNIIFELQPNVHDCKDIVYSQLKAIIGLPTPLETPTQLRLFDFLDIDIYGGVDERISIQNLKLELEMYVLSEQNLLRQGEKVDPDESIYHRLVFETVLLEESDRPIDFGKLLRYSHKKKIKYLQKKLLGNQFEWRVREFDQLL